MLKLGEKTLLPAGAPDFVHANNQMISSGLDDVGRTMLILGSLGAGVRTLQALPYLFGRARPSLPGTDRGPVLEMPVPVYTDPGQAPAKKRRQLANNSFKTAGTTIEGLNPIGNLVGAYRDPLQPNPYTTAGLLAGHQAYPGSKMQMPWYPPALLAGGLASLGIGYGGMGSVLAKKRKADLKTEIEEARREYHDALLSNYDPEKIRVVKQGSLTADLDELAELVLGPQPMLQKRADPQEVELVPTPKDPFSSAVQYIHGSPPSQIPATYAGYAIGGVGALAALAAMGTGYLAHSYHSKRDPAKLLSDVIKERAQERLRRRPAEVYPVPVSVSGRGGRVQSREDVLDKLQGEA